MTTTLQNIINFLKKDAEHGQRTIAFYSTSPCFAPWEWMVPLAAFLQQKNYAVMLLSTYPMEEIPSAMRYVIIDKSDLPLIAGLHCIITMDTDYGPFPADARVLAVAHGHQHVTSPTHLLASALLPARYDGYVVNFPLARSAEAITRLWTGLLPSSAYNRSGTRFDILACGYLRTAAIQQQMQKDRKPDALCYAPILRHYAPWIGGDRIAQYGEKILYTLLHNFPEYKVIFRPTHSDLSDEEVQHIIARFRDNPRFELDASHTKVETFDRSAAVITDISHIANSFAFTCLRPAIAFRPWENRTGFAPAPHGGIVSSTTALVSTLRAFLDNGDATRTIIQRERDKGTCPPETAFEDFALLLEGIFAPIPPIDTNRFLSIPRVEYSASAVEFVNVYSLFAQDALISVLAYAFFNDLYPHSALIPGMLILERNQLEPQKQIPDKLRQYLGEIVPIQSIPTTYGEAKELGLFLVKMELAKYIKTADSNGMIFCEKIVEQYK